MASDATGHDESARRKKTTLDPLKTDIPSSSSSKLETAKQTLFAPFSHKKRDSARILADLAPVLMTPRMMTAANTLSSSYSKPSITANSSPFGFATLGRAPMRMSLGTRRITSRDLQIIEATDDLLQSEVPEPDGVASNVSLLRGFNATIPSADQGKSRRRQMRSVDAPRIGLKKLGMSARGMMTEEDDHEGQSVASEEDVVIVPHHESSGKKGKRRGRESLSAAKILGKDELTRQRKEIVRDKENLHVKRSLINNEIAEITHKIEALDTIRDKLEQDLLKLQEDELELEDELEGVKERIQFEQTTTASQSASSSATNIAQTSRRRKGPAFLPSEHDELPQGVAFMTLEGHSTPITALDFSEPYGTLVTASQGDSQPRVWDLFTGSEIGRLRGHSGTVKCMQVEDHLCLTGGEDGNIRVWDLRRVDGDDTGDDEGEMVNLSDIAEESEDGHEPSGLMTSETGIRPSNSCARLLEGHSKAVTSLYFEDNCLVTGASDKTLRQWDLNTGQCVMTMDILWAISQSQGNVSSSSNPMFPSSATSAGHFSVPTPQHADGSWDLYEDFVGGVQFWGYGLVSGSGDGAVRMWDMRTGQAHRTLVGHTAAVTCLQFDELHIVSGSLDKTIRIWDLRTGGVFETLSYDYGVSSLQFDSRKIVAATGTNEIEIYNRTNHQRSKLITNGHLGAVERLRYMDRYLVSGGRDAMVKIWSL